MLEEIKHYKLNVLPEICLPNKVYYIKGVGETKVKTYITNKDGVPTENVTKWGDITEDIYEQTDLIELLNTKVNIGEGLITAINVVIENNTVIVTAKTGTTITGKIDNEIITVSSPVSLPVTPSTTNTFRKDLLAFTALGFILIVGTENLNVGTLPNLVAGQIGISSIDVFGNTINATAPQAPVDISAPSWVVYGPAFGKYTNGMTVPANTSQHAQTVEAHTNILPPNYLLPVATLTSTASPSGLEVGQPLTIPLSLSFNQRNGGPETVRNIKKDGVVLGATTDIIVVGLIPITYLGNISYSEGAVINNILGVPDPTGRITIGNVNSGVISYVGIYPYFYLKSSNPITAASMAAAIESGVAIQVTASSGGTLNIPYAPNGEYLAVAYPAISTTKTRWFVTDLSQGNIGVGGVFGTVATEAVNSKTKLSGTSIWTNVNYKIHVSPLLTNTGAATIQLRNS